ncbi:hypothetical protein [Moritella dasanensis]|uniref:hypothetical protein n=1 Tax=Moritella dasanensis TaxID=428031 RepID=UPI0002DCEF01|nr:hypothetical protein [Moritella dasanensis]
MAISNKLRMCLLTAGMIVLAGCDSDSGSSTTPTTVSRTKGVVQPVVTQTFPADMLIAKEAGFTRYSELLIDNAGTQLKLRIIATDDAAKNEKIIRASNIMQHLLQDVDGASYGSDKASILRTMAERQATLILTKDQDENNILTIKLYAIAAIKHDLLAGVITKAGVSKAVRVDNLSHFLTDFSTLSDGEVIENDNEQDKIIDELTMLNSKDGLSRWLVNSQSLQYRELSVEGDCHYMSNFEQVTTAIKDPDTNEFIKESKYCTNLGAHSDRDAAFEEILHLVQAQGIASNPDTHAYQEAVRSRAESIHKSLATNKPWNPTAQDWIDWADDDTNPKIGSTYSHEYLAAVLEAFMGMNGHKTKGLDGYTSTEREQISAKDNIGDNFVREMFAGDLQYTARIQTAGVVKYYTKAALTGTPTFKMQKSSDAADKYTFKSQYLKNAVLVGTDAIDLIGNDKDNILEGNIANNTIRACAGNDTYVVTKTTEAEFKSCTVVPGDDNGEVYTQITCPNTGTDKLYGFNKIKLSDGSKAVDATGHIN